MNRLLRNSVTGLLTCLALAPLTALAALNCSVTTVCASPNIVLFKLYDPNGDHAELATQSNYPNLVCCGNVSGVSNSCSGTHQVVLRLHDVTNSHVEQNDQGNYTNDVCLSEEVGGSVTVGYQSGNCSGFDTTVASISDVTNAHVGDASAYPLKICANASASSSGSGGGGGSGGSSGGGGGGGGASLLPATPVPQISGDTAEIQRIKERLAHLPMPPNSLVKIATDSAVYYVAMDGMRHAFPNSKTYFSWFCSFDGITTVSASDLASIQLSKNIVYRPGSRLVKFQTSPTVYFVTQTGLLRAIPSEAYARANFGALWMKQVDDISDAFFLDYVIGVPLKETDPLPLVSGTVARIHLSDNMGIPGYVSQPVPTSPISCSTSGTMSVAPAKTPVTSMHFALPASYRFTYTLDVHSTDSVSVRNLQIVLSALGPSVYPEAKVTGNYGPATMAAVKRFQKIHGINPNGVVGPATREVLNALLTASK